MRLTQRPTPNPTSPIPHKIVVDSPNSLSLSLSLSPVRKEKKKTKPNPRELHSMDQRTSQNDNDNRRLKSPLPNAVPGVKTSPTTQASATFPAQSPAPPRPSRRCQSVGARGHCETADQPDPQRLRPRGKKIREPGPGVIGLMYAGLESGIVAVRDTTMWLTAWWRVWAPGALYRAAAGVRSAAVAGAIGGVVVGAAVTGEAGLKRYVPI
ncbi:hypothetical protein CK203_003190 [Vitis vinifera]|uniref:Uncharacterized protein n=1 Tax=Vitis vinifera TaxID=29760 RepID=A0A438K6S3_VITVI|nr:hypothetical protein CK203_003190 [Vitis vinifera]